MKKSRILASASTGIVLLLSLTGCMSISMDITINEDQTANASYSVGYDKEAFIEMLNYGSDEKVTDVCAALQESQGEDLEGADNVEVTWTETDTQCILKAKSLISSKFDETGIQKNDAVSETDPTEGINIVKDGDNAVITFDTSTFTESMGDAGESAGMSWDTVINEFNLNVTFPGEISESNFSSKISDDKHTVSWDKESILASANAGESLQATGALSSGLGALPFIVAGVILLLMLIALIVAITLRKNRQQHNTEVPAE